jgi:hypothetical protein
MILVSRASGPRRIYELIMQSLLHVLYDGLLVPVEIFNKQSIPCRAFYDDVSNRLADSARHILSEKRNNLRLIRVSDGARSFTSETHALTLATRHDALPFDHVSGAESTRAENAHTPRLRIKQSFAPTASSLTRDRIHSERVSIWPTLRMSRAPWRHDRTGLLGASAPFGG